MAFGDFFKKLRGGLEVFTDEKARREALTGLKMPIDREEPSILPEGTKDVLKNVVIDFPKTVVQETARTGGSVGLTIQQQFKGAREEGVSALDVLKQVPGVLSRVGPRGESNLVAELNKLPETSSFQPTRGTMERKIKDLVFGPDPLESIPTRIQRFPERAAQFGIPEEFSKPIAPVAIFALTAIDFTGGGGRNKVLKELAESSDIAAIKTLLQKIKTPKGQIDDLAENLVRVTDPKVVDEALKSAGLVDETVETVAKKNQDIVARIGDEALQTPQTFNQINKLNIDDASKVEIQNTVDALRPELEAIRGEKLTNDEVIEAAKSSGILRKTTTREETLRREAQILKTKQHIAALAEGDGGVSREFLQSLEALQSEATNAGRTLQSLNIIADPSFDNIKVKIIKDLFKMGKSVDEVLEAAKGVDFNDAEQVTDFYRKFVKPTLGEQIDEFRYINLLSSPRTHIVNSFSNLLQSTVLAPGTKLATGLVDVFASKLTGKARQTYLSEVPAYYKGFFNATGDAVSGALDAIRGKTILERPDVSRIPSAGFFDDSTLRGKTIGRAVGKFNEKFQFIPRALEAGDVLFRTLIRGGEAEAVARSAVKRGLDLSEPQIMKQAADRAEYFVFRKALDPANKTGQGIVLSKIDQATSAMYKFRTVPGVRWFVPFLQTPMNIFKQGIEYSPAGFATLPGSANKMEQAGKALIGSTVFTGAAWLAFNDQTTWATPSNEKQKDAFYAAGLQPFSVKIGDKWVSYSKLGPLAYPLAMGASLKWFLDENPDAVTETTMQKTANVLGAIASFFADQSYVQGVGNMVDALQGKPGAAENVASNIPRQVVPLSSLQGWIARMIDPIYRKGADGPSLESIVDDLKKGIPGLSKDVEPYTNPAELPSERQFRFINGFSPFGITKEDPEFKTYFNDLLQKARENKLDLEREEVGKSEAEELYAQLKSLPKEEAREQFDLIIEENKDLAEKIVELVEDENLGLTYQDKFLKSLGVEDGMRARFILRVMDRIPEAEKKNYYQMLIDKKIITPEVNEQVVEMKDNPDLREIPLPSAPRFDENTTIDERTLIETISIYSRALKEDPLTAFKIMFTSERLRRIDGDTLIMERMPFVESQTIRAKREATNEVILDHTIPLQLGGSNDADNLKLVPLDIWESYTPVENHLGRLLRDGKISGKKARKLIEQFKNGEIPATDILQIN